ncbi:hypothetical protein DRO54_03880 [Candidatus Bathyarchaeota archaeon]|nr:MAG: hypothetical protein DRO54_03880 [Candidatus Bathyarchaeota archaeon]
MSEVAKKVNLLKPFDISKISIKRDRYFPNAYIIDLPLDSVPDHIWQYIFEQKWKSSRHLWDRKLFVIGDKLRLVTSPDNFEEKLDWIEQIIKETNKAIDEHNAAIQKEVLMKVSKQASWEEKVQIETLKEILRRKCI